MIVPAMVGLAFGFLGSVPVAGPISAIVLHQGIRRRYASAVSVGVGGAVAEGAYAFVAFWAFSRATGGAAGASFLGRHPWMNPLCRAVAALILVVLGVSFLRYRVAPGAAGAGPRRGEGVGAALLLGLSITLLNPTLIATWTATAATLYSAGYAMAPRDALPFALGVSVGVAGWFGLFAWLLRRYGERFQPATLQRVVRGMGIGLLLVSAWFLYRCVSAIHRPA